MSKYDDKIREEFLALEQYIEQLLKDSKQLFGKHERVRNLWLGQLRVNVGSPLFQNVASTANVSSSNNTENEGLLKSLEVVKKENIQVNPGDHFVLGEPIKLNNIQEGDRVALNVSITFEVHPAPPQSGDSSIELVFTRERLDNVLTKITDNTIRAGTKSVLSFSFVDDTPVEGKDSYSVSIRNGGLGLTIKQFTFTAQVIKPNE